MNSSPKTVYWRVARESEGGRFKIEFWRKPDHSDRLHDTVKNATEEDVRKMITSVTGLANFVLEKK